MAVRGLYRQARFRVSEAEYAGYLAAAGAAGLSFSEWVRGVLGGEISVRPSHQIMVSVISPGGGGYEAGDYDEAVMYRGEPER